MFGVAGAALGGGERSVMWCHTSALREATGARFCRSRVRRAGTRKVVGKESEYIVRMPYDDKSASLSAPTLSQGIGHPLLPCMS